MSTPGLLLFAHGARDPQWARPFEQIAAQIQQQRPALPVVLAFLEFMAPNLSTAAHQLQAQGCTEIEVLPLFLGAGGHVRKDLPRLMAEFQAQYPQVQWRLHPAIGEIDSVVAAMATAVLAAVTEPSTD